MGLTVYVPDSVIVTVRVHEAETLVVELPCDTVESAAKGGRRSEESGLRWYVRASDFHGCSAASERTRMLDCERLQPNVRSASRTLAR